MGLEPAVTLQDLSCTPERFFAILPPDWQCEIVPYWPEYAPHATVYGLLDQAEVIAGGIVFTTVTRDIMAYREVAQEWLDKGYHYIGFLYVLENRRKEGLGSLWIKAVQARTPAQPYWLAIDEYSLVPFYKRLGFQVLQEVRNGEVEEWILATGNFY